MVSCKGGNMGTLWDRNQIKKIHCFGDSLTAGFGAGYGEGWLPQLQRMLPTIELCNHGVCGEGLEDIFRKANRLKPRLEKKAALFFMGGTNDILMGMKFSYLAEIWTKELEIWQETPICIGIPPLCTKNSILYGWQREDSFERNQRDLTLYGDFLRNYKEKGYLILDFSSAFPLEDKYYDDGIHPNRLGYKFWAEKAYKLWKP